MKQKKLEMRLQPLRVFEEPKVKLEQYHTPVDIAATVVHCAHSQGHIEGLHVVDLGCGPGILGIACALMGSSKVTFVDVDEAALAVLRANLDRVELGPDVVVEILCADVAYWSEDATHIPLVCDVVMMNPPFGTRVKGIDMVFLKEAAKMSRTAVYSLHKSTTRNHISKSVLSLGFESGKAISQVHYNLEATHKHHKQKSVDIEVDLWLLFPPPVGKKQGIIDVNGDGEDK